MFVGGERVSPELIQAMQKCFPAAQIFIGYGPTETTIITSLYAVVANQPLQHHIMGRPLRNTILYICDQNQRLVPISVPGELFIGGAGPPPGRSWLSGAQWRFVLKSDSCVVVFRPHVTHWHASLMR